MGLEFGYGEGSSASKSISEGLPRKYLKLCASLERMRIRFAGMALRWSPLPLSSVQGVCYVGPPQPNFSLTLASCENFVWRYDDDTCLDSRYGCGYRSFVRPSSPVMVFERYDCVPPSQSTKSYTICVHVEKYPIQDNFCSLQLSNITCSPS